MIQQFKKKDKFKKQMPMVLRGNKETTTQKNQGKLKKSSVMIKRIMIMTITTMIKMTMIIIITNYHHKNHNLIGEMHQLPFEIEIVKKK